MLVTLETSQSSNPDKEVNLLQLPNVFCILVTLETSQFESASKDVN